MNRGPKTKADYRLVIGGKQIGRGTSWVRALRLLHENADKIEAGLFQDAWIERNDGLVICRVDLKAGVRK